MKIKFFLSLCLAALLIPASAYSDDHEKKGDFPMPAGVETFVCTFNDGYDIKQLLQIASHWSLWAEKTFEVNYNAWILTPRFMGASIPDHDFVWLGAADSPVDLGIVNDTMMDKGQRHYRKFSDAAHCTIQEEWYSMPVRYSPDNTVETGVIDFHRCKTNEGFSKADVSRVTSEFQKIVDTTDMQLALFRWLPGMGVEHQGKFDHVDVVVHDSMETRAKNNTIFWTIAEKWQQMTGAVRQCSPLATANFIQVK